MLYLLPAPLSDNTTSISQEVTDKLNELRLFAVENVKETRRYIRKMGIKTDFDTCQFVSIHHKTDELVLEANYTTIINWLIEGKEVGVLSDAGLAGIADPAAQIVALAHENEIELVSLSGPSSIFLALNSSGLNGQQFTFHGYLPIEKKARMQKIKAIAAMAATGATQIFMETPYRNNALTEDVINNVSNQLRFCIAANLTGAKAYVKTKWVADWHDHLPDIHKQPAIFLLGK